MFRIQCCQHPMPPWNSTRSGGLPRLRVATIPREVTVLMIEHDMDVVAALDEDPTRFAPARP